jgi:predicted AAA+ superfamily ATPase
MARRYLPRNIEPRLRQAARHFPILVVTGPRQTGKTTLLTHLFPKHRYITFDNRTLRQAAKRDPAAFLEDIEREPVLLDEIQYVPELLPYLKIAVDKDRNQNGRFLLTGSQVFPLMAGITESLAGRAGFFELLGFSWKEIGATLPVSRKGCFQGIFRGFYPDPAVHHVPSGDYYGSYLTSYLERDVRQVRSVHDLSQFQAFLELLAARAGSLLNLNDLCRDAGVSHGTARGWISILETTRIVYLLHPYFRNVTKRVVKHPKIYFTDTGLLAHLLKYQDPATLGAGPAAGAFFENMVVIEFLKRKFNYGETFELYFYRDSNGNEIDLVLDTGSTKILVEIKSTKNPSSALADVFDRAKGLGSHAAYVASFLEETVRLKPSVKAIPWWRVLDVHWSSSDAGIRQDPALRR